MIPMETEKKIHQVQAVAVNPVNVLAPRTAEIAIVYKDGRQTRKESYDNGTVLTVENLLIYPSYPSVLKVGEVYVYKIRK